MKRQLRALVNRFPRLKAGLRRILPARGVSSHYVELDDDEASRESSRLRSAWQDNDLPARQRFDDSSQPHLRANPGGEYVGGRP